MPIVGIGTDVVDVDRMSRALRHESRGKRLRNRVFTTSEQAYCEGRDRPVESYAARFAAKEAVLKALRRPAAFGFPWADIEVLPADRSVLPRVHLSGRVADWAREQGITNLHISLAHDAGVAVAHAVAESGEFQKT